MSPGSAASLPLARSTAFCAVLHLVSSSMAPATVDTGIITAVRVASIRVVRGVAT